MPRSHGKPRVWWGWLVGIGAVMSLGLAAGVELYLSHVQHLGQAYQQLNQDAKALAAKPPTTKGDHTRVRSVASKPSASPTKTSPAPKTTTAPKTAYHAPAIPKAVQSYTNVLEGRVGALLEFPATAYGPQGALAVTVMIDTGNAAPDGIYLKDASRIGLHPTGQARLEGITGSTATVPTYGSFAIVPHGHLVKGTGTPLVVPSAVGLPRVIAGAGVNLGQYTLSSGVRLVEAGHTFWLAWNTPPGTTLNKSPAPASQSPTPTPTRANSNAAPGTLGVVVANPPRDWTAHGCEVVDVVAHTTAAHMGLIGADNRIDPVGDVISAITDNTTGHTWPVANCADFKTAIRQISSGQTVTVQFYYRKVFIVGHWVAESRMGVMGPADHAYIRNGSTIHNIW